jgi:prephenate dehydratase
LNDEDDNKTRFYLLGRDEIKEKNSNGKTAIILSTKNKSGALCDVLQIIKRHDINLTYIDSRPSRKKLGEYLFFIELEGYETTSNAGKIREDLAQYKEDNDAALAKVKETADNAAAKTYVDEQLRGKASQDEFAEV